MILTAILKLAKMTMTLRPGVFTTRNGVHFAQRSHAVTLADNNRPADRFSTLITASGPIVARVRVVHSTPVIRTAVRRLRLQSTGNGPLEHDSFLGGLDLTIPQKTSVTRISCRRSSPSLTRRIIGALVRGCLSRCLRTGHTRTMTTHRFLTRRLPLTRVEIERDSRVLQHFRRHCRIASLARRGRTVIATIRKLHDHVTRARTSLTGARTRARRFERRLKVGTRRTVTITTLDRSPKIRRILARFRTIRTRLTLGRAACLRTDPIIRDLLHDQSELNTLLRRHVATTLASPSVPIPSGLRLNALGRTLINSFTHARVAHRNLLDRLITLRRARTTCQTRVRQFPRLRRRRQRLAHSLRMTRAACTALLRQLRRARLTRGRGINGT